MGKKLVIKGADFSVNGFTYEVVTKNITTLYKSDGTVLSQGETLQSSDTRYFYETTSGELKQGGNISKICVSTSSSITSTFVDVEDYTHAEVTTICNINPASIIKGAAIMFFLDSSMNIIGGFSTGDSLCGCLNKGASNDLRTLSMDIPTGSKYVVCTYCSATNTVEDFKLTLSKEIIS
jgi:hypothetical protein